MEDFKKINEELALYSDKLVGNGPNLSLPIRWICLGAEENYPALEKYVTEKGYPIMKASAATGDGLRTVMYKALKCFKRAPRDEEMLGGTSRKWIPIHLRSLRMQRTLDFEVKGKNIERLVV